MANRFMQSLAVLEENEAQAAVSPPPVSTAASTVPLIADIVTKMPRKKRGDARNIYFSNPVLQILEREAKRRDIKVSTLVNEILKRVFGVE